MPTTDEFFHRVLPPKGPYYFATQAPGKKSKWNQQVVPDLAQLSTSTTNLDKHTYFATASYAPNTNRDAENVISKKSFYIDADAGPDKPYKTLDEIKVAFFKFLKKTNLPLPNAVVVSGNGIHFYWILGNPITPELWMKIAAKLRGAAETEGFHADHDCTTDITRVLRVPGTYNVKDPRDPKLCRIVTLVDEDVDVDDLLTALVKYTGVGAGHTTFNYIKPTGSIPGAEVDPTDLGEEPNYGPKYAKHMIGECGIMARMHETGGEGVSEPGWMHALTLLAFCEDGGDFVHAISEGHKDYSEHMTNAKFARRIRSATEGNCKPILCKTLRHSCIGGEACDTCPHAENITSPITLGAPPTDGSEVPWGYLQNARGVWLKGDDDEPDVLIAPFQIEHAKLIKTDGELFFSFDAVGGAERDEVFLSISEMGDPRSITKQLPQQGIILQNEATPRFIHLMKSWSEQLKAARQTQNGHEAFGWTKSGGKHGFAAGAVTYWEGGGMTGSSVHNRTMNEQYQKIGELDEWKAAADLVIQDNQPGLICVMATAFGAPLMEFTAQQGGVVSSHSNESGTGKTTVARTAQAVWGDPIHGMNSINDTDNSVLKRAGYLGSLPVYMDELRGDKVEDFVKNVIFRVTQGKEKSRLKSSTEFQRIGTWKTLMSVSTNERLLSHMDDKLEGSDAGHRRVLEFTIPVRTKPFPSGNDYIMAKVEKNYGHAGAVYAQFMVDNRDLLKKMVKAMDIKFRDATNADAAARFWTSIAAALSVGAHVAKQLGLVNFDVKAMNQFLVNEIKSAMGDVQQIAIASSAVTTYEITSEYMNQYQYSFVRCDLIPTQGQQATFEYPHGEPRNLKEPIRGFIADTGEIRMAKSLFMQWLTRRGAGTRDVMNNILKSAGSIDGVRIALDRACGPKPNAMRTRCIGFTTTELEKL